MKKLMILLALFYSAVVGVNAQILRTEELEEYVNEMYGEKYTDAAQNLASSLSLDQNNALTYSQIIDAPNKTKDELYVLLNYWFTASFNDANSVIKLNDKDLGTIIAQGFQSNVAAHTGGANSYIVNLQPIIKCDIKDEKVRITYTIPYYTVEKYAGGGIIGALGGSSGTRVDEKWTLDKCFPFAEKDSHKKTSSKALMMAHAYSNVVMDKIEACIENGLTGNEEEDW